MLSCPMPCACSNSQSEQRIQTEQNQRMEKAVNGNQSYASRNWPEAPGTRQPKAKARARNVQGQPSKGPNGRATEARETLYNQQPEGGGLQEFTNGRWRPSCCFLRAHAPCLTTCLEAVDGKCNSSGTGQQVASQSCWRLPLSG